MGLSGKKVKQRIPNDPRNLSWADDAARFGSNYLSKFGWDASKGLGAAGEGRTSHVKVTQKLDMMGIGAAHQRDPNGIAWKQNRDFENVLRRLNDAEPGKTLDTGGLKIGGFYRAQNDLLAEESTEDVKEKKRKHKDEGEDASDNQEKKRERKSKEKKTEDKTEQAESALDKLPSGKTTTTAVEVDVFSVTAVKTTKPLSLPRHRSHRARAIAAKNMSSKSANHISEILGIAPSPFASGSATPQEGKLTSLVDEDVLQLEKITTSTKSVADYFKEKLKARATLSSSTTPSPLANDSDEEAPRRGIGSAPKISADPCEDEERPRFGLGVGASRLRFEASTDINEARRIGLSQFSKLTSSTHLAATTAMIMPISHTTSTTAELGAGEQESEPVEHRKKDKKEKKRRSETVDEGSEKNVKKKRKKDRKGKAIADDTDDEPQPGTMSVDVDDKGSAKEGKRKKEKNRNGLETESVAVSPAKKKKKRKDE